MKMQLYSGDWRYNRKPIHRIVHMWDYFLIFLLYAMLNFCIDIIVQGLYFMALGYKNRICFIQMSFKEKFTS